MNARLQSLLSSKHTTLAAMLYGLSELCTIWFPDWKSQLGQTQDWIIVYAFVFAGDSRSISEPKPVEPPKP